jgi:hypothetical protein
MLNVVCYALNSYIQSFNDFVALIVDKTVKNIIITFEFEKGEKASQIKP